MHRWWCLALGITRLCCFGGDHFDLHQPSARCVSSGLRSNPYGATVSFYPMLNSHVPVPLCTPQIPHYSRSGLLCGCLSFPARYLTQMAHYGMLRKKKDSTVQLGSCKMKPSFAEYCSWCVISTQYSCGYPAPIAKTLYFVPSFSILFCNRLFHFHGSVRNDFLLIACYGREEGS